MKELEGSCTSCSFSYSILSIQSTDLYFPSFNFTSLISSRGSSSQHLHYVFIHTFLPIFDSVSSSLFYVFLISYPNSCQLISDIFYDQRFPFNPFSHYTPYSYFFLPLSITAAVGIFRMVIARMSHHLFSQHGSRYHPRMALQRHPNASL